MATIRTLKLKANPSPVAAVPDAPPVAPAPPATPPGLDAAGSAGAGGAKSHSLMFWLALGIAACGIAVLALQFSEYSFYREPPSVWPLK